VKLYNAYSSPPTGAGSHRADRLESTQSGQSPCFGPRGLHCRRAFLTTHLCGRTNGILRQNRESRPGMLARSNSQKSPRDHLFSPKLGRSAAVDDLTLVDDRDVSCDVQAKMRVLLCQKDSRSYVPQPV
jgi:hypothetical protein